MNKKILIISLLAVILAGTAYVLLISINKTSQPAKSVKTIFIINPGGDTFTKFFDGFIEGMKNSATAKEDTVNIIYNTSAGDKSKLAALVDEAVSFKPSMIVTISSEPTFSVIKKTSDIPVLTALGDPVEHGYFKSLRGSEINLAGIAQQNIELTPKRFELLKKMVPSVKKVAVFYDTSCGPTKKARPIANTQASELGLTLVEFPLTNPSREELASALSTINKKDFDALMFYPHGTLFSKADLFLKRAREEKMPIIMPDETSLKDGAIASYGPDYADMGRSLARIAEKVLNGADAGSIPFEQPSKIQFIISLSSARELGIKIPAEIQESANRIVE